MTSLVLRALEPLDVIYLRGNRLFEGSGDDVAVMPPWPSLFAGAIRSHMLASASAVDAYGRGTLPSELIDILGPSRARRGAGSFRVVWAGLVDSSSGSARIYLPAPSDIVTVGLDRNGHPEHVDRLRPLPVTELSYVRTSLSPGLLCLPAPRHLIRSKPSHGFWLDELGFSEWQRGRIPARESLLHASRLWQDDVRIGIAMDRTTRTTREGLLYTSRAVSLAQNVAFCVATTGATESQVPASGILRLGGDGRGAQLRAIDPTRAQPFLRLPTKNRFVLCLATPGAFPGGSRLPGLDDHHEWRLPGTAFRARLLGAVLPRHEVISGWSLGEGRYGAPKPAVRTVPAGAVYWMEKLDGDFSELCSCLTRGLGDLHDGLGPQVKNEDVKRANTGNDNPRTSDVEHENVRNDHRTEHVRTGDDETSLWRSRAIEGFGSVWLGDLED